MWTEADMEEVIDEEFISYKEWLDDLAAQEVDEEIPAECERCGNPFGGAAVKVGSRWVCTEDEEAEYADYDGETARWMAEDIAEDQATKDEW